MDQELSLVSTAQESTKPVFADERQAHIIELVRARGRVHNTELTAFFKVTEATIRKDLTVLQKRGVLKRTHGGAIAVNPMVERELGERAVQERQAKEVIARLCIAEITKGDAIFIDSGTTTQFIADLLVSMPSESRPSRLTVLTNSIGVAEILAEVPTFEHVLLGGNVRRIGGSVTGSLAIENLQRFAVNVAFIGASGLSEAGLTVANLEDARLKAAVIERSRSVMVPLDHTKLGATHFAKVCDLRNLDVVITDQTSSEFRQLCVDHGIRLVEARTEQGEGVR
jgi:DeoR/GlpR family transcriptional regulator of sugar metabolism